MWQKSKMSSNCKEGTNKEIIEEGSDVSELFQHSRTNNVIKLQMKDLIQKQRKLKSTKLGNLKPQQQSQTIKQQIGRKIRERQLSEIRNMSISEVNSVAERDIDPPADGSRLNRIRLMNMKLGVTEEMMEHSLTSPGEKHIQMIEQSQVLRRYKIQEFKKDPIMSQIKRGKLGVDNFFIFFGIFGSLMIPLYVYHKFKKHREDIINSRIASPEVIRRLDEDSPIDLDDVSYHTIHYYNPDRAREHEERKKKIEEIYKMERELYF